MDRALDPSSLSDTAPPAEAGADPGEAAWMRTAPWPEDIPFAAPRYRGSRAWLAAVSLAIGGSALYLSYAAMVAPALPARPTRTAVAALRPTAPPAPAVIQDAAAATPPDFVAPPVPAAWHSPPDSVLPQTEAETAAPMPIPAVDTPPPRAERHRHIRRVRSRPAPHRQRATRHSFGWYLGHPFDWLAN